MDENGPHVYLVWGRRAPTLADIVADVEPLDAPLAWLAAFLVVGSFGVVFLLGLALSELTLRSTRLARTEGTRALPSRALGRAYALVIAATVVLFYVVTPMVLVGTVVGGVALLWHGISDGHFHVKGILLVGGVVLLTVFAAFSGLLALFRRSHEDPGLRLDFEDAPRLRKLLDEVAAQIGTHPIDTVFLTPTGEVAVFERRGERCLILGIGLLEGFSLRGLRAVLAHEYGHFANRDTAGGSQALAVRRSLEEMLVSLRGESGGSSESIMDLVNPTWLFLRGYQALFLRVSQGASRLQEYLADRWAAVAYGADSFEEGFRHVVRGGLTSELSLRATLEESLRLGRPVDNLFRYRPAALASVDLEPAVHEALTRPAGPYDSHPSPLERFAWVRAVAEEHHVVSPRRSRDDAWTLFADRSAIERAVSEQIRARLVALGLPLPEGGPESGRGSDAESFAPPSDDTPDHTNPDATKSDAMRAPAQMSPDEGRCPAPGAITALWSAPRSPADEPP